MNKFEFIYRAVRYHHTTPARLVEVESELCKGLERGDLEAVSAASNRYFSYLATNTAFGSLRPEPQRLPLQLHQTSGEPLLFNASFDGTIVHYTGDFCLHTASWPMKRLLAYHRLVERMARKRGAFPNLLLHLGDCFDKDQAVLTGCSNRAGQTLIPDADFMGSQGYGAIRKRVDSLPAWPARREMVFWRGGVNCQSRHHADWQANPRIRLCQVLNSGSFGIPCDAGVVEIDYIYKDPAVQREIHNLGIVKQKVPLTEFGGYRFLVDIDGFSNAWSSFFVKLLMGAVVFKVESANGYRQWYYRHLEPFQHYIPVASDLSDFEERINWAKHNPERCGAIAKAAAALAADLSYESQLTEAVDQIAQSMVISTENVCLKYSEL